VSYVLSIDLNVLDHLGINLYSNVPAVLTEIVANAWDADASRVDIELDIENDRITVADDGIGMTHADINQKLLLVGYRRRGENAEGDRTAKQRPVMGRKGVGKLAPFSIADEVEVYSTKDGERCGLRMRVADIRAAAGQNPPKPYHPEALDDSSNIPAVGTRILLRRIKRERARNRNLRERLARRFSVIGTADFRVFVNREEVTARDRGDLTALQYLWTIGEWHAPDWLSSSVRTAMLSDRLEDWESSWRLSGWLGTSHKPKDLVGAAGNLNGIVILARGRLFQENILGEINDGRHYTKYLTGQLQADFLDASDQSDIATSDRQRVVEDDRRYQSLIGYLRRVLNALESQWSSWRTEDGSREILQLNPAAKEWVESLPTGFRKHAERLLGRIQSLDVEGEQEERSLLRHAILGFERLRLKGDTEELANAIGAGPERLLHVLADQDSIEASLYRDIVKSRLEAIKAFQNLVDDDEKEKVLQRYLFQHLWLLAPSWERATQSLFMEERLRAEGVILDDLTEREKLGRVDIGYRTAAGKHVVVELKRAGRRLALDDLFSQGRKYVSALRKILAAQGELRPNIEVVFVVGKPLQEEMADPDGVKNAMASISPGSRIVHYDGLIRSSLEEYGEYLAKTRESDRISAMVERI
jgi:hypothetical protein